MTVDHQIDYSFVGKGAKRRAKQTGEPTRASKTRPYLGKPEAENRKARHLAKSEAYHTAIGVKARIRLLVVDRDASYLDICEIMKREGCPVTGVTIGNLRTEMREIMKMLDREGLLNTDALAHRRKKIKARDA